METATKIKHTPGPWKFDKNEGCKFIKGGKRGGMQQAQYTVIAHTVGLANEEKDEANAKLIAAAPDLLDKLQKAYDFINTGASLFTLTQRHELEDSIKETIKKATE